MPRTEFHRKFAQQIEAIKSVAQANERVAVVLEKGVANIPDHVIALAKNLNEKCRNTGNGPTNVKDITYGALYY